MAANALRFATQPAGYTSEGVLTTQPVVEAYDTGTGAVDATFTGIVTLTPSLASAKFYTVTEPIATTHTVQAGTTGSAVLLSPALSFPASLPSDYTGRGYWLRDDHAVAYASMAPILSNTGTGQVNLSGGPVLPTGAQVSVHSGVLFPTFGMACVAGVAAFTNLRIAGFETVTLTASAPGLTSATSSAISPTGTFDFASELPRVSLNPAKPSITDATVYTINPANNDVSPNFKSFGSALTWFSANESTLNRQINVTGGSYNEVVTLPLRPPTAGALWFQWATPLSTGTRAVPLLTMVGCPSVSPKDQTGGTLICATYAGGSNTVHDVFFQNIDFTFQVPTNPAAGFFQIIALYGDTNSTTLAGMPDNVGFVGCMARGTDTTELQRGIYYAAKRFFWVDGYISDVHMSGNGDTQSILFAVAQGPALVRNSYLEAAGEDIMLGGLDTTIPDCVPSDIEILGNHFRKPLAWKRPGGTGTWSSKNMFETKSCRRILIEGNVFENSWADAQTIAIIFGSANQNGGCPWAGARDITFRRNVVRNVNQFFAASKFNNGAPTVGPAYQASRIALHGNLVVLNNSAPFDLGADTNVSLFNGVDDFHYEHNTTLAETGKALYLGSARGLRGSWSYNLMSFRTYGVIDDYSSHYSGDAFTYNFATSAKNVLLDLDAGVGAPFSAYDQTWGNSTIAAVGLADPSKFSNPATRLATIPQLIAAATLTSGTYANTTWTGDGAMVGADMTALAAATANSVVTGEGTNLASDTAGLVNYDPGPGPLTYAPSVP